MENPIVFQNKLFKYVDTDLFEGYIPIEKEYEEKNSISLNWKGGRVPWELWCEICTFMRWSFDTYKAETIARLYYDKENLTWYAWVFPQEVSKNSLSIQEQENSEKRNAEIEYFFGEWLSEVYNDSIIEFGTVHHHCNVGASQSGTDKQDETPWDGLHITLGDMPKDVMSVNVRFVKNGFHYNYPLWYWVELPDNILEPLLQLPNNNHVEEITDYILLDPPKAPIPERWQENITEAPMWTPGNQAGGQAGWSKTSKGNKGKKNNSSVPPNTLMVTNPIPLGAKGLGVYFKNLGTKYKNLKKSQVETELKDIFLNPSCRFQGKYQKYEGIIAWIVKFCDDEMPKITSNVQVTIGPFGKYFKD